MNATFKSRYGSGEEEETTKSSDYKFEEGVRRAHQNLEEMRFKSPSLWEKEVRLRRLDRQILQWLPEPERLELQRRWRAARDALL